MVQGNSYGGNLGARVKEGRKKTNASLEAVKEDTEEKGAVREIRDRCSGHGC